jgi:DNA-binding NarL/FixJ family response regulator
MTPIRVLICDDHPVVREGLAAMLRMQPDIEVCGEAANGQQAIDTVRRDPPDIVLMDLRMPVVDGVSAMRQIHEFAPDVQFIVLTTYDNDEYIFQGIQAGARGFLLKDSPREELFKAIRAVSRGESLLEPAVAGKLIDRFTALTRQTTAPDNLSERELEVVRLMATGAPNKIIAERLSISGSTVKTHIQSIFQKINVSDRTEAVTEALRRGLIELD